MAQQSLGRRRSKRIRTLARDESEGLSGRKQGGLEWAQRRRLAQQANQSGLRERHQRGSSPD